MALDDYLRAGVAAARGAGVRLPGILDELGETVAPITRFSGRPTADYQRTINSLFDGETVADALSGTVRPSLRSRLGSRLKPSKKRLAIALPILGAGGYMLASRGETPVPTTPYDPTKIAYPGQAGSASNVRSSLDRYLESSRQAIIDAYSGQAMPNMPGASALDPLAGMTNQMGGASLAEMQSLANQAASDAAAIRAGGQSGAASINDIYGSAAADLAGLAAQGGEYGSLTPVSGEMAVAPGQLREAGSALSDYLNQNQLISAQDQGFLSELSGILGPAYANQFLMQDQASRAAAAARQQRMMAEAELNRQQQLQQALAELALSGTQMTLEQELKGATPGQGLVDPLIVEEVAAEYLSFTPSQLNSLRSQGIGTIEQYISARLNQLSGE